MRGRQAGVSVQKRPLSTLSLFSFFCRSGGRHAPSRVRKERGARHDRKRRRRRPATAATSATTATATRLGPIFFRRRSVRQGPLPSPEPRRLLRPHGPTPRCGGAPADAPGAGDAVDRIHGVPAAGQHPCDGGPGDRHLPSSNAAAAATAAGPGFQRILQRHQGGGGRDLSDASLNDRKVLISRASFRPISNSEGGEISKEEFLLAGRPENLSCEKLIFGKLRAEFKTPLIAVWGTPMNTYTV